MSALIKTKSGCHDFNEILKREMEKHYSGKIEWCDLPHAPPGQRTIFRNFIHADADTNVLKIKISEWCAIICKQFEAARPAGVVRIRDTASMASPFDSGRVAIKIECDLCCDISGRLISDLTGVPAGFRLVGF